MAFGLGGFGIVTAKSFIMTGLPGPNDNPPGPADKDQWYHEQMEKLPATRVRGYFGTTIGSPDDENEVQIFFFEDNHLKPTLRLVIDKHQLAQVWFALGKLLEGRYQLVKMIDPAAMVAGNSPQTPS